MSDQWANSNSTASRFLGGGRQPAWLSAAALNPRTPSRPHHQPASRPPPPVSTAASAPLQTQTLQATAPNPASVLPSPTPSEDRNHDKTPAPAPVELDSAERSVNNGAQRHKRRRVESAADVRVSNTALPRPSSSDAPVRTGSRTLPISITPMPHAQVGGPVSAPSATDIQARSNPRSLQDSVAPMSHPIIQSPVTDPPATDVQGRSRSLQGNVTAMPQTQLHTQARSRSLQGSVASMPHSQFRNPASGPPAPDARIRSNPWSLPGSVASTRHPQAQSPVSVPPTPPSYCLLDVHACSVKIMSLRARFAGTGVLSREPARSRLAWLERAVQANDETYLFFHQVMCLANRDLSLLPPEITQIDNLAAALDVLRTTLDATERLDPALLHWFSRFPPGNEQTTNAYSQHGVQVFRVFARRVNQNWLPFCQSWERRRYPPLARELDQGLGMSSELVQRLFFFSFACRFGFNAGGGTGSLREAGEVFDDNQRWWRTTKSLRMRGQSNETVDTEYLLAELERQTYGSQYLGILHRYRRVQAQSQPLAPQSTVGQNSIGRQGSGVGLQTRAVQPNLILGSAVPTTPTTQTHGISPIIPQLQGQAVQPRINGPVQGFQRPPQTNGRMSLIPPAGHISAQPAIPSPNFSALHQAHLRSPILMARQEHHNDAEPGLFQRVIGFAMSPRQIDCENPMQTFEFNVSGVEFARIARSEHPKLGQVPTVFVDETAITYRLRCARSPTSDESRWLLADNVWPEGLFLEINSCDVEFRRKLHHGKDLPVDLTPHIREGSNELKLAVVRTDMKTALAGWALAVEMVGLATQETIKQDCLQNRIIPADTIKSGITNHLNAVDSGDEIMIVNDSITINLVDPFSGCLICEIPVRGVDCPHREAFDLDVFLMTRPRKKPNAASFVDVWKCPICKGDARPKCLIVDGFLLEVRAKLAEQGLLNKTRSIIFEKDGSWKPMAEEDDDQQGESANSEKQPQAFKSPPTGVQPVVDIIDLDSD